MVSEYSISEMELSREASSAAVYGVDSVAAEGETSDVVCETCEPSNFDTLFCAPPLGADAHGA